MTSCSGTSREAGFGGWSLSAGVSPGDTKTSRGNSEGTHGDGSNLQGWDVISAGVVQEPRKLGSPGKARYRSSRDARVADHASILLSRFEGDGHRELHTRRIPPLRCQGYPGGLRCHGFRGLKWSTRCYPSPPRTTASDMAQLFVI